MKINTRSNWQKDKSRLRITKIKRYLSLLGIATVALALVVGFSIASASGSSAQPIEIAESETQFAFDIVYAYIGQGPSDSSYTDTNGALMSPRSLNPSAVVLNITRIPCNPIKSCDAEIEVYKVQISSDTGAVENHCYFIGTNNDPSFSDSELSTLFERVKDLSILTDATVVRGNFEFNWTQNTSFLSLTIGSTGHYSTAISGLGLWRAGTPNNISVTLQRVGYMTISNGSISIYKDAPTADITAITQLDNYGKGFLHNSLVPADKLSQTNLFHPSS